MLLYFCLKQIRGNYIRKVVYNVICIINTWISLTTSIFRTEFLPLDIISVLSYNNVTA